MQKIKQAGHVFWSSPQGPVVGLVPKTSQMDLVNYWWMPGCAIMCHHVSSFVQDVYEGTWTFCIPLMSAYPTDFWGWGLKKMRFAVGASAGWFKHQCCCFKPHFSWSNRCFTGHKSKVYNKSSWLSWRPITEVVYASIIQCISYPDAPCIWNIFLHMGHFWGKCR